jgi:hypothetical protein
MKVSNTKGKFLFQAIVATGLMAIFSCQPNKETIVERDRYQVSVNDKMSSEELSLAAEQLVGPYTFMLAYKTAEMALAKDPTNFKAEFYVKFLKRLEAYRGFYYRIRPILNADELKNMDDSIAKFLPNSPFRQFLLDESKPQLTSPVEFQEVLSEYYNAVVEFRQLLKLNQTAKLELFLNPHVFEQQIRQEVTDSCQYVETPDNGFVFDCNQRHVASKKLNTADLIVLRQMASTEIIYSFFNSYSMNGAEKLKEFDPENLKSNKLRTEFLMAQPGFGKLRKDQTISMMKELGSDMVTSLKWVLEFQKELCPKGYSDKNQRRGYLYRDGICITNKNEVEQSIALFEKLLGGVARIGLKAGSGEVIDMNLDLFAWSKSPIQDLRQVQPTAWSPCDKALSFKDNTLGGVFIDNNISVLLNSSCKK